MKKQLAVFMAVLTMLVSAGCTALPTSSDTTNQNTQQEQTKDSKNTKAQNEKDSNTVGELPGIGDTLTSWEKEFGHPFAQGDTIKVFKNGTYKTVFEDGKAVTITFPSKNGDNPLSEKLLPRDGEKLSETSKKTGNITMIVQKWHSNLLASAIPATQGSYTIMKSMNGSSYDSVIVDCSPNLQK